MNHLVIFSVLFFLAACTSPASGAEQADGLTEKKAKQKAETKLEHDMVVRMIDPTTFVVIDTEYRNSNTLVARMEDNSVMLVSSPFESEGTEALVNWARKKWAPSRIIAVNTHFHMDGTGGNEAFKKLGVETWASEETRNLQLTKLEKLIQGAAQGYERKDLRDRLARSKVVIADQLFSAAKGKTFSFASENVEVFYPGPAHTEDNLVVSFPKRKILFGGCMIKPKQLGYLGDADVKSWADSAQKLTRFDAKIVVPGHGPWGGPELVSQTIDTAKAAAAAQVASPAR